MTIYLRGYAIGTTFILLILCASNFRLTLLSGESALFLDTESSMGRQQNLRGESIKSGFYMFSNHDNRNETFFLNLSGYEYKNDFIGGNFGLGARKRYGDIALLGSNLYFDYQRDIKDLYRIGVGFECFSDTLSMYGNVYYPIKPKSFGKKYYIFDDYIGDYKVTCTSKQIIPIEFDLNFCKDFQLTQISDMQFSLGIYGLHFHQCSKVIGFQGSLEFILFDCLHVQPEIFSDKEWGTHYGIKLGLFTKINKNCIEKSPLNYKNKRTWFIPSKKCCDYETNY